MWVKSGSRRMSAPDRKLSRGPRGVQFILYKWNLGRMSSVGNDGFLPELTAGITMPWTTVVRLVILTPSRSLSGSWLYSDRAWRWSWLVLSKHGCFSVAKLGFQTIWQQRTEFGKCGYCDKEMKITVFMTYPPLWFFSIPCCSKSLSVHTQTLMSKKV